MARGKGWHQESLRHSNARRMRYAGPTYKSKKEKTYSPTGARFKKLQKEVAKGYVGKKVPKKYQKLYGKRYSKQEAMDVGAKVAGKRFWGVYGKRRGKEIISKEVRKTKRKR